MLIQTSTKHARSKTCKYAIQGKLCQKMQMQIFSLYSRLFKAQFDICIKALNFTHKLNVLTNVRFE